jgi:hypothetical protein
MVNQKKFLLLAIMVGIVGVVIGSVIMFSAIEDLLKP